MSAESQRSGRFNCSFEKKRRSTSSPILRQTQEMSFFSFNITGVLFHLRAACDNSPLSVIGKQWSSPLVTREDTGMKAPGVSLRIDQEASLSSSTLKNLFLIKHWKHGECVWNVKYYLLNPTFTIPSYKGTTCRCSFSMYVCQPRFQQQVTFDKLIFPSTQIRHDSLKW